MGLEETDWYPCEQTARKKRNPFADVVVVVVVVVVGQRGLRRPPIAAATQPHNGSCDSRAGRRSKSLRFWIPNSPYGPYDASRSGTVGSRRWAAYASVPNHSFEKLTRGAALKIQTLPSTRTSQQRHGKADPTPRRVESSPRSPGLRGDQNFLTSPKRTKQKAHRTQGGVDPKRTALAPATRWHQAVHAHTAEEDGLTSGHREA